ncbi:hypothetical protein [Flavobacterium sp.]|uniref:hypothetical protein n=1 Tax=Flavobacterium sp. TaxID=239 RepID=UPI00374DF5DD
MQKEILSEIKELRTALTQVLGISDLPPDQQFLKEALNKAAKEFQKLNIERGQWVADHSVGKYIKNAGYRAGAFIRQEFGFSNYFKRGQTYYYSKKDLISLGKELKERNVDLGRYMEFIEDRTKFKKYVSEAAQNNKGKLKNKSYKLPADVNNITTSPPPMPEVNVIREDIKRLKEEFFEYKLSDYIDIYKDNYAMTKFIYHFEKYLEPGLKRRCKKWCDDFNYANHALEEVTKKKEKFIPVKDEDMIQL